MVSERELMVKQEQIKDTRRQRELERLLQNGEREQTRPSPDRSRLRFLLWLRMAATRSW